MTKFYQLADLRRCVAPLGGDWVAGHFASPNGLPYLSANLLVGISAERLQRAYRDESD